MYHASCIIISLEVFFSSVVQNLDKKKHQVVDEVKAGFYHEAKKLTCDNFEDNFKRCKTALGLPHKRN